MRLCSIIVTLAITAAACGDNHKGQPDAGVDGGPVELTCAVLPPSANTCDVTAGNATTLIKGTVLTPSTVYKGGQVAVDTTGHITCVGCNCATGGETTITCPDAAISPGLINTHDHITYTHNDPYVSTAERYDDRQQWREGKGGHYAIPYKSSATADQVRWGELRFLMGGATSIVGSGGQAGLLRNLDQAANEEGLAHKAVNFDTFPLDDAGGTQRTTDCNYGGSATTAASIATVDAYEPHTSEGINAFARNEFLCESSATYDTMTPGVSNNLLLGKTAMIHAIGLTAADYGAMATAGTALIWSPRSNLTLYGETARVTTAARLGVEIALGTDWMPSGSMNLLRELACADSFNATYLDHYFTDDQLWKMVTVNAAAVTATDDAIGLLAPGKLADITIFASHGRPAFRSVIEAAPQDVALVMRGGKVLYGDDAAVSALAQTCDTVDVCGTPKRVCTMTEVGKTYGDLKTAVGASMYPAFTCAQPVNEPSCVPNRPLAVAGSSIYTGVPGATDPDGDGIPDATDNCPRTFNPIRPLDNGVQGDADLDGKGDACDPCPLDANTTTCTMVDPNDRDHDSIGNTMDNCPDAPNRDQLDDDHDGRGNACDACPTEANAGGAGCPKTIYQIKGGMAAVGSAVHVSNALVTGRGSNGFFVQVKEGDAGYAGADNSGLFVFTSAAPLATAVVGARVDLDGSVANFQGQIELDTVTSVQVTAAGPEAPPAPIAVSYAEVATGGTRADALEGVIVSLGVSTVTAVSTALGEITLTDPASTTLIVDDFVFAVSPLPAISQGYAAVTGILALRQMMSKLEPRGAGDLTLGAPGILSFSPALSFARVGTTTDLPTFPQPLTITLTSPALGPTTIVLVSSDPSALTVASVTIPDAGTTAQVPVTAVAPAADVTVTAMLGVQIVAAHVRVLGETEVPATVTLSPASSAIAPNASVQLTATLEIPALATTTVALSCNPVTAGTLPITVDVPAGQTSASFTYTDTSGTAATITASFLASTSTATVAINSGANHLIINEIDYDQPSTDATEFVEIYNPTGVAIPLANKALVLVNGGTNPPSEYATVDLGTASMPTLGSHEYLVLGPTAVLMTLPNTVLTINTGWANLVQNGAPDGVALIDTAAHTLIDALSYEGAIMMVTPSGFPSSISLVEGTALPAAMADSGAPNESLCRSPDGNDTDNAATDWKVCTGITPGAANP